MRRVVGPLWVVAVVLVLVGQVPFSVFVGAEERGRVAPGPVFDSADGVPGLVSEPVTAVPPTQQVGERSVGRVPVFDADAEVGAEIVERRDRWSRSFERSDGFVEVEVSPVPVAFDAGDGRMELVDTSVEPVKGGGFEATRNEFGVSFGDSGEGVVLTLRSGREVRSVPSGLDGAPPVAVVEPAVDPGDDSVVWYRQVWPGVDLRYTVRATGVAEDVVYTKAPQGAGAVSFEVSGAELDAVWSSPAVDVSLKGGDFPERVDTPAASLGLAGVSAPRDVGGLRAAPVMAVEVSEGVRAFSTAERPSPLSLSSLAARGPIGAELGFGELVAFTAGGERRVDDGQARPLARTSVTAAGESVVEYSLDPSWLQGLDVSEFPVVLDPDLVVVSSNGWYSWFSNPAGFQCGSDATWCWVQSGNPRAAAPYAGSYWRSIVAFDLTGVRSVYGLSGSGSNRIKAASVELKRELGSTAATAIAAHNPTAMTFAGAKGPALGNVTGTSAWSIPVLAHVRSAAGGAAAGTMIGITSDNTTSHNHKETSAALLLTIDPSPPAPAAVAPSPADGKAWFASSPTAAPLLQVGAVADTSYKPAGAGMKYRFSVSDIPVGPADFSGNVASRPAEAGRSFQLDASKLRDGKTYWWRAWTNNGWGLTPSPLYSFRYDRRLGAVHASPMQQLGPVSVNAATGNAVFGWSSSAVPTVGGEASVALAYNTAITDPVVAAFESTPGLPAGWTGSWGQVPVSKLDVTPGGSAVVRFTDGSKESFTWTGGAWAPDDPFQFSVLSASGAGFQWQSADGWVVSFTANGNVDTANSPADDRSPAALTYQWGTAGGKQVLRSVVDPVIPDGGRKMVFSYGGDSTNPCPSGPPAGLTVAPAGMLCRIAHMDGSITVFWYSPQGDLARIVEDANGDLATGVDDQSVTDMGWANSALGRRIATIRSPHANRLAAAGAALGGFDASETGHVTELVYDSEGRVSSVTGEKPDATHVRPKVNFTYSAGVTTATDANRSEVNGYSTRWELDAAGRATRTQDRMGRSVYTRWKDLYTDQVSWVDSESLDAAGTTSWLRTGNVYDDRGRATQTWGPAPRNEFGATSPTTGTATGGANTAMTATTYDGAMNGLSVAWWAGPAVAGTPVVHGHIKDAQWSSAGSPQAGIGADGWAMRGTGSIRFPSVGLWQFRVHGYGPVTNMSAGGFNQDTSVDPGGTNQLTAIVDVNVDASQVGKWMPVAFDTIDTAGTGGFDLQWRNGTSGTFTRVPVGDLRPEFGLPTRTDTRVGPGNVESAAVSYDDPATPADETYLGIPRVTTVDPDGLALKTAESFEAIGPGNFLRRTSRTLPSGAASTVTYAHYDPTEAPIAAECGVAADTPQLGFLKQTTQADPDGPGGDKALKRQYIYDDHGRQVGYRASTDIASEPWTCTSFDDAGRVDEVDYPAWGDESARTATYNYAVGNKPTVTSVSDPVGTITATSDWAGRVLSYEDVWGIETSTVYDDLGRVISRENPGGDLGYTYGVDDRLTQVSLDGDIIATPTYDSLSRMSGVTYPASGAGNGTAGVFSFDDKGLPAAMTWTGASSGMSGIQLRAAHAGTCMDVEGPSQGDGAPLQQWECLGVSQPNQIFDLSPTGEGWFKINTWATNKCVTVTGASTSDGAGISQQPCTDTPAQQFKAEPVTGGYRLVAKHSNKCLEIPGGATGFGIDMAQQACTTAAHQKWTITDPTTSSQQNPPAAAVIAADAITSRDLTDRILNQAINGHDPNGATPNYTYDKASRLTAAVNFAGTPAAGAAVRTTSYDYTSTGCGLTPTAGRNGNRVKKTTNGTTVAYCYDHADRLTATTDPAAAAVNTTAGTLGYDTHGNTSRLAGETHAYDVADRHIQTGPADPANPDDMATVTYKRDATDRIVTRQASGEDEVRYAHSGAGDAPQLTLNASNQVLQTSIGLPGGAVLHRSPPTPGGEKWSYPNLQGSIVTQTDSNGVKTGGPFLYDPDGIPIHGGLPDTRPGAMDDTYLGGHSRPLEHAAGLQPVIEMGARQYHPVLARFLEVDPIEGGVLNDYGYVTDPINQTDLTGAICQAWKRFYGDCRGYYWHSAVQIGSRDKVVRDFGVFYQVSVVATYLVTEYVVGPRGKWYWYTRQIDMKVTAYTVSVWDVLAISATNPDPTQPGWTAVLPKLRGSSCSVESWGYGQPAAAPMGPPRYSSPNSSNIGGLKSYICSNEYVGIK